MILNTIPGYRNVPQQHFKSYTKASKDIAQQVI